MVCELFFVTADGKPWPHLAFSILPMDMRWGSHYSCSFKIKSRSVGLLLHTDFSYWGKKKTHYKLFSS